MWQGTLGDLGIEDLGDPAIRLDVNLGSSPVASGFRLQGAVRGSLELTCDRCLDALALSVSGTVDFLIASEAGTAEIAASGPTIVLAPSADSLDLVEQLRDALYLELPQKALCREDCKGLCPDCGQNWNHAECSCAGNTADPRWAPLQAIKEKLEQVP